MCIRDRAGVAHPGIPVGIVLTLGADELQQLNGVSDEIPVHFTVGPMPVSYTHLSAIGITSPVPGWPPRCQWGY